jgi:hypothetical protein
MDFIEGRSLAEVLRARTLPGKEAARLLETLAEAVHYAHSQGVVHRDLKPSNVLIDAAGRPHITDFGLARHPDRAPDWTASGSVLGTPSYMSPEQAAGGAETVGPVSDVYSLGAILYEALVGRPPFRAPTPLETLKQVLESEPTSLRTLNPQVPVDLQTICLKCLEKEPARRYASADELRADLARFLRDEPVHARPLNVLQKSARWARRRPTVAGLTAAVAILLVAGLVITVAAYARITAANRVANEKRRLAEEAGALSQRRLALSGVANGIRILDGGDWFGALPWLVEALKVDPPDAHRERMHRLRLGTILEQCPRLLQVLPHEGEVHHVEFSPDGRFLLTSCYDRAARIWEVGSGRLAVPPLRHEGQVNFAFFSADGSRIVTASDDGTARVWETRTGQLIAAPRDRPARCGFGMSTPAWRCLRLSCARTRSRQPR